MIVVNTLEFHCKTELTPDKKPKKVFFFFSLFTAIMMNHIVITIINTKEKR